MREAFKARQAVCLKLLFEHYRIDANDSSAAWKLAMALAEAHVPAFQVKRTIERGRERRAKKPLKLDAKGTKILFIYCYLKDVEAKRKLTPSESKLFNEAGAYVKGKPLRPRTVRDLNRQLLSALWAYFNNSANDFQIQFVEEVYPSMGGICSKLLSTAPADDGI